MTANEALDRAEDSECPFKDEKFDSVFAVMKRGLIGVYHHASKKHLPRYVDEFAFRLNDGRVQRHTLERLESFVSGTKGKRPPEG